MVYVLAPLTARTTIVTWQFAPVMSGLLAGLAAAYLAGVLAVWRRHPRRPWPARRTLSFLGALIVVALATQGGIGVYDGVFAMHMVQHLLLIMVTPPLLVYGRPVTLVLHSVSNPAHTWVKRIIRSPAAAALTWPPVAVALYVLVVAGTHLSPLRGPVLGNPALHDAEHAVYLVAGYLYFLPVLGSEPLRWKIPLLGRYLLLVAVMPVDTGVGAVLMLHQDLRAGGLVMVAGGDLIMTALAIAIAARFLWSADSGDLAQDRRVQRHHGYHRQSAAEGEA